MPLESSDIGDAILAYLYEHPDSSDTVEGITQWWLLERKIECQIKKIKEVLADLVKKEWLIEDPRPNARIHYRLNKGKHEEIQTLLEQRLDAMRFALKKSYKG